MIEGLIDTTRLEPEGPFGESHGHVALEEFNMPMRVTAITHRKNAIVASYLSQVTPSESSAIKRVAYEPMFLAHLNKTLGIRGVKRVTLHERMTALRRIAIITVEKGTPRTEVWRALYGATSFKADCGKICIAVNDDIDPENSDALFWAIAFRMNPSRDLQVLPYRSPGHGPEREHEAEREDSTLLMDATMKEELPPLALPEARIHGTRAENCGKSWDCRSCGRSRRGSARRGRLAAAVGRSGEARGRRPLSRERPHERAAAARRSQARNALSAGRRELTRYQDTKVRPNGVRDNKPGFWFRQAVCIYASSHTH